MFIKYPKIKRFSNAIKSIHKSGKWGLVEFTGTVKTHGVNSGIVFDTKTRETFIQSRNMTVSLENNPYGLCSFIIERKDIIKNIFSLLENESYRYTVLYGELCGGNIQRGVGIEGMEKSFIIFDVGFSNNEELGRMMNQEEAMHIVKPLCKNNIYPVYDFGTYKIAVKKDDLEKSARQIHDLTISIEENCPVADKLHKGGIGEGIVWRGECNGKQIVFKSKGEKHKKSRKNGKTNVSISPEIISKINTFVDDNVTDERIDQAVCSVFTEHGVEPDISGVGPVIGWVRADILIEEEDSIISSGVDKKQLISVINRTVVTKFKEYLERIQGYDSWI